MAKDPGQTFKNIADMLHIAEVTIHTHVRNMKSKLGFNRKGQLIKYALDTGLCG